MNDFEQDALLDKNASDDSTELTRESDAAMAKDEAQTSSQVADNESLLNAENNSHADDVDSVDAEDDASGDADSADADDADSDSADGDDADDSDAAPLVDEYGLEVVEEAKSLIDMAKPVDLNALTEQVLQTLPRTQFNLEGFRLERVDLYNWSSFNNNVKTIYLGGNNVLMTGDNGAGKSSVIDAITVLLCDSRKITFNQAAGADHNERSLSSYVLGLYKNENNSGTKVELGLRSRDRFVLSIIMGSFYNEKLNERVVLIQTLHMIKPETKPHRKYFISNKDFNLQEDLLPVANIDELVRKLKALGCMQYKSFSEYFNQMQRSFGIEGTKVIDLFYKTISMKSISNISDFVRDQMLEDFDSDAKVNEAIACFDDLNAAYNAVEEAKRQVDALRPICNKGEEYQNLVDRRAHLEMCRNGSSGYIYNKKAQLLKVELDNALEKHDRVELQIKEVREEIATVQDHMNNTRAELSAQGGNRVETIKQSIRTVTTERERVFSDFSRFAGYVNSLGLPAVEDEAGFNKIPPALVKLSKQYDKNLEEYNESSGRIAGEISIEQRAYNELDNELSSLQNRKNNIPSQNIRVRERICAAVGCEEKDLPFVGELLQVKPEEKAVWEFAIEKRLKSFAISMLVPEKYYAKVVNFTNNNKLDMRLVFYRVRDNDKFNESSNVMANAFGALSSNRTQTISAKSLVRKLEIKQEPLFYAYLKNSLETSYNYVCTEDEAEFRAEREALMPSGLSKRGGRNEKDDRVPKNGFDFVLGWSNEEKIAALRAEIARSMSKLNSLRESKRSIDFERDSIQNQKTFIKQVQEFKLYSQIDYKSRDKEIERLNKELEEFLSQSSYIESLEKNLREYEAQYKILEERRDSFSKESGQLTSRIEILKKEYNSAYDMGAGADDYDDNLKASLERLFNKSLEILSIPFLRYEHMDRIFHEVTGRLTKEIDKLGRERTVLGNEIVNLMANFTHTFEVAGRNLDSSRAEAWVDFKAFLEKLEHDDLPRFVDMFRDKLSRETLERFANLNAHLNKDCNSILDRIEDINSIMYEVDFNTGHYIKMLAIETDDLDIKQFRMDLKNCTSNIFDIENDLETAERKFQEVKLLIDRLKGEVDGIDIDNKWRKKVTNVKLWFKFSASEHSREDDSQVDYYEDSGGKSGGQKEKLAYTVLASSIAYQYRSRSYRNPFASAHLVPIDTANDPNAANESDDNSAEVQRYRSHNDRSFRFIIIDEAFGRGSPASVDYALTLFAKFRIQLLVATPLQKLDVMEKYVNHVAYVYRNEATHESAIINYDVENYILKRKLREQKKRATVAAIGLKDNEVPNLFTTAGDLIGGLSITQVDDALAELEAKIQKDQAKFIAERVTVANPIVERLKRNENVNPDRVKETITYKQRLGGLSGLGSNGVFRAVRIDNNEAAASSAAAAAAAPSASGRSDAGEETSLSAILSGADRSNTASVAASLEAELNRVYQPQSDMTFDTSNVINDDGTVNHTPQHQRSTMEALEGLDLFEQEQKELEAKIEEEERLNAQSTVMEEPEDDNTSYSDPDILVDENDADDADATEDDESQNDDVENNAQMSFLDSLDSMFADDEPISSDETDDFDEVLRSAQEEEARKLGMSLEEYLKLAPSTNLQNGDERNHNAHKINQIAESDGASVFDLENNLHQTERQKKSKKQKAQEEEKQPSRSLDDFLLTEDE